MSDHDAAVRDACSAIELMAWNGAVLPLRVSTEGHEELLWQPVVAPAGHGLRARLQVLEHRLSADVSIGLPRPRAGHGSAAPVTMLWARVEGKAQSAALRAFRPGPNVVVREGGASRYVALWALGAALPWEWAIRANKRLAHALGAPKKYADPDTFEFAAPGSVLRKGRKRPVVVSVARCELDAMRLPTAADVVGRLRDAPDADAWRKAAA